MSVLRKTIIRKTAGKLTVEIHPERSAMGNAAAPSQNEVLAVLVSSKKIDWLKITAFNMDEYIGLPPEVPQRFSSYLNEHIFSKVRFADTDCLPELQ